MDKKFNNILLKIIITMLITFGFIILKSNLVLGTTAIPKVYFTGDISQMLEKSDERKISLRYESKDLSFDAKAKIKIQGTSSIGFDKKNYTITLYKDDTYEEKKKVDVEKGWGAQNKYCLKANWIDKTHSRNIVSARIAAKAQEKYGLFTDLPNNGLIDGYPVEIYSNDEFLGLYTWNIPKSDWMWGMDEDNPNNIALVGDDWTDEVLFNKEITDLDEAKWEVEIGEENQETIDKFNRVLNFVANSSEEFKKDFELYINKDSALNYLIMVYAMHAGDNLGKNMGMITYDGKIWYPSLYDLDSTWGTWSDGEVYETYDLTPDNAGNQNKLLIRMIECFPNEVATRWFELREDILSKDNILEEFKNFMNDIPKETDEKDAKKWGERPGYGIDQIENYLDYRLKYVDDLMEPKLDNKDVAKQVKQLEEQKTIEDSKQNTVKFILTMSILIVLICTILIYIKNK